MRILCEKCKKNEVLYADERIETLAIKEGFRVEINGGEFATICQSCFTTFEMSVEATRQAFKQGKPIKQVLEEWLKNYE